MAVYKSPSVARAVASYPEIDADPVINYTLAGLRFSATIALYFPVFLKSSLEITMFQPLHNPEELEWYTRRFKCAKFWTMFQHSIVSVPMEIFGKHKKTLMIQFHTTSTALSRMVYKNKPEQAPLFVYHTLASNRSVTCHMIYMRVSRWSPSKPVDCIKCNDDGVLCRILHKTSFRLF